MFHSNIRPGFPNRLLRHILFMLAVCPMALSLCRATPVSQHATADSLFQCARTKLSNGEQTEAMEDLFLFLKIADEEKHPADPERYSHACLLLGNIYFGYGDYKSAVELYRRGVKLSSDPAVRYKFIYNLSMAYCLDGNGKSAREYRRKLQQAGHDTIPMRVYDLILIDATIERTFGNRARAATMFKHALAIADSLGLPPTEYATGPISQLGAYYESINMLDSARYWGERYEQLALQSRYPHAIADSRRTMMKLHLLEGNTEKALEYGNLYLASIDSLVDFKRFITISSKREREREAADAAHIENLEFTISKQKLIILAIGIFLAVGILTWIVIRKMRGDMRHLFARNRELAILEADKSHAEPSPEKEPAADENPWHDLMQKVNAAVSDPANFCDSEFSMNALAAICGSNTLYISKAINETTGDNFRTLLNSHRIHEARRRLTSDPRFADLTIQSIGESVGFRSASNFINAFKKVTGMTPALDLKMMRDRQK